MTLLNELKELLERYPDAKMINLDRTEVEDLIKQLERMQDDLR